MMANLKYEFIKLFTVRSTYILSILGLAFSAFIMIITLITTANPHNLVGPEALKHVIFDAPGVVTLIGVVAAILVFGHEYRHNVISYTLTASRSRLKIMLAKLAVVVFYSAVISLLAIGVALVCYYVGLGFRAGDVSPPAWGSAAWGFLLRAVLYSVGLASLALLITSIARNIVFAIVAFFMLPTIEQILSIWLKDNVVYLPASALDQVTGAGGAEPTISPLKGGLIFLTYFVVGSIISYILFVRRDAN